MPEGHETRNVHESLQRVTELLRKHEVVENLVHRSTGPRQELVETLVHRMHLVELQKQLDQLHPADVAWLDAALKQQLQPRCSRSCEETVDCYLPLYDDELLLCVKPRVACFGREAGEKKPAARAVA